MSHSMECPPPGFSVRLPATACHEICQRCTVIFSLWVSVCVTVIKTSNVHVHNSNIVGQSIQPFQGLNNVSLALAFQADPFVS